MNEEHDSLGSLESPDSLDSLDPRADLEFLVELERDGALDASQRARLTAADPGELSAARRRAAALSEAFEFAKIDLPADFTDAVLARLPATPPWASSAAANTPARLEARPHRLPSWALPLAALLVFAVSGAVLAGGAWLDSPASQVSGAMLDFVVTIALTGAGLVAPASAGAALADLWSLTSTSIAAFAILALGVDLAFFYLLRRRPARDRFAPVAVDSSSPPRR